MAPSTLLPSGSGGVVIVDARRDGELFNNTIFFGGRKDEGEMSMGGWDD